LLNIYNYYEQYRKADGEYMYCLRYSRREPIESLQQMYYET